MDRSHQWIGRPDGYVVAMDMSQQYLGCTDHLWLLKWLLRLTHR